MARLRASWRTSLPVVQQPRNPQSESIARSPYDSCCPKLGHQYGDKRGGGASIVIWLTSGGVTGSSRMPQGIRTADGDPVSQGPSGTRARPPKGLETLEDDNEAR